MNDAIVPTGDGLNVSNNQGRLYPTVRCTVSSYEEGLYPTMKGKVQYFPLTGRDCIPLWWRRLYPLRGRRLYPTVKGAYINLYLWKGDCIWLWGGYKIYWEGDIDIPVRGDIPLWGGCIPVSPFTSEILSPSVGYPPSVAILWLCVTQVLSDSRKGTLLSVENSPYSR